MSKVFIIAEAGVNHNGNIEIAKHLVDAAKEAGVDAVKFQSFNSSSLVSCFAEKADYQKKTTRANESQLEMIRRLELTPEAHLDLLHYCSRCGIEFLSTAFDDKSIDLLRDMNIRIWKIPSGEITNLPYLRRIGALGKPILLSTGMATLGEVEAAIAVLESAGTLRNRITILHCTTEYPAPIEGVNLRAMITMGEAFGLAYGYSDHTQGITIPIAAAALGATVIEKHFTLSRNMEGPDHLASLEPNELKMMTKEIREVELALGNGIKRPNSFELKNLLIARKSIVAARSIKKGENIDASCITAKRPGTGISPMEWDRVLGSTATRDYLLDEQIVW